ncbi:MAG: MSCRAMM family protein [Granulosicoccaceae bacterium]
MFSLRRDALPYLLVWTLLSSTGVSAARISDAELIFAGLYINDEEQDGADLYTQHDTYWVLLDQLAQWVDIQVDHTGDTLKVITPLGSSTLAKNQLRDMPEGLHVDINTLSELGIKAIFDQNAYALVLYAPWVGQAPPTAALNQPPQKPQYLPKSAGLTRLYNRLDASHSEDTSTTGLYSDALGHMANGVWGLQTTTNDQQETQLSQLHWHTFNRNATLRLGTAKTSPGPLLESTDFAGFQLGYSNHNIHNHLAANHSVSRQMFVDDAAYSHDISGAGPKGGIAELRLNDRPIARVRIALDGRFLFQRLPITQGNTDRVEVALYEYSLAQPPIEVINYTTASKPRAVSTREVMITAGFGAQGSTLEDSAEDGEQTSYGSLRYGISNFLTLEAAAQQQAEKDTSWYLGMIASLNHNLATSIGAARAGESENIGAEVWGDWQSLKASYRGNREIDTSTEEREKNQELSIRWDLNNNFSLVTRGLKKERDGVTEEEYLAPGLDWKITPRANFSIQPINADDYNARLSLRSAHNDVNIQLRSSREEMGVGTQYAINDAFSLAADYALKSDTRIISAAASYRPRHNNDSVLSAQVSQQDRQLGYAFSWRQKLSPRTQFNFNYHRQLVDNDALLENLELDSQESVGLSIESELWLSPGSGWRGIGLKTNSTHGALHARLLDANGEELDLPNASLKIEEANALMSRNQNGQKVLTGLEPGDYNVSLLADGLPIEYESNATKYRVRVAPATTTKLDITLQPHYGISGLLTIAGHPAPYSWVEIWRDGEKVSRNKTDGYGYYQASGLQPGQYELRYKDTIRSVQLVDDFVFDMDLAATGDVPKTRALDIESSTPLLDDDTAKVPATSALLAEHTATENSYREIPATILGIGTKLPNGLGGRIYYNGEPLSHTRVVLQHRGKKLASVTSDSYGYYSFHHLLEGEYQVLVNGLSLSFNVGKQRTYDAHIYLQSHAAASAPELQP